MERISIYKLTSKRMAGCIYLSYEDDHLVQFQAELRQPLDDEQWQYLRQRIPLRPADVADMAKGNGLKIDELKIKSAQDKIVAFGMAYKHYRGVNYIPKDTERANITKIPVTRELLTVFFTSNAWFVQNNYTLTNFIKRINNLKDLVKNGLNNTPSFPDKYDQAFEKKLPAAEIVEYHKHLRALGFVRKTVQMGDMWVKEA